MEIALWEDLNLFQVWQISRTQLKIVGWLWVDLEILQKELRQLAQTLIYIKEASSIRKAIMFNLQKLYLTIQKK